MSVKNKEWIKLGAIKKSTAGKQYIALGTSKSKYKPVTVEITIKDAEGNVLYQGENPNFTVQNPRKRPGISEEEAARIPEYLMADISLPPAKEE